MAVLETTQIKTPGGAISPTQSHLKVSAVISRGLKCIATGWDGNDAPTIETDWIPVNGRSGTIFIPDNTEDYDLNVEVVVKPAYDADGNIDFGSSVIMVFDNIPVVALDGGAHYNFDYITSHIKLSAGGVAPTLAFDTYIWQTI